MTLTIEKFLAGAVAVVILAYGAFWAAQHHHQAKGTKQETQAQVFKGEANAQETQARQTDSKVENDKAAVVGSEQVVARVEDERAPLRKAWNARQVPPNALPAVAADDRAALIEQIHQAEALIEKDQEDINALQKVSTTKDVLIASLTLDRDQWKATADLRQKQAMAQEAATAAWKDAVAASKWRGRVEGFAAGVALGYVGGRLK